MSGYLDRIGAGKILVNREPMSFDWMPINLVGRDKELSELASMFSHIENHNSSCRSGIILPAPDKSPAGFIDSDAINHDE